MNTADRSSSGSGLSRREVLGLMGAGVASLAAAPLAQAASHDFDAQNAVVFAADDLQSLTIDWAVGSVDVFVDDALADGAVRVSEQAFPGFLGLMPPQMNCKLRRNTLTIDYGATVLGFIPRGKKELTVVLPSSLADHLETFTVNGASGEYLVTDVASEEFNVNLASGRLVAEGIAARDFDLEIASGTVTVDGTFERDVDLNLASGTVDLTCHDTCPQSISLDAASGKVALYLPENNGFEAQVTRLSGSIAIDFETTRKGGNDEIYVYGNGTDCFIDVDIMSGSVTIGRS